MWKHPVGKALTDKVDEIEYRLLLTLNWGFVNTIFYKNK